MTSKPDFYLLFGDGLWTFGDPSTLSFNAPLYSFCSSPKADFGSLRQISKSSGGAFFNLSTESEVSSIVSQVGQPVFSLVRARYNSACITELLPSSPVPVASNRTILVGKMHSSAAVGLDFGFCGKPVSFSRSCHTSISTASSLGDTTGLLARYWGMKKMEELIAAGQSPEVKQQLLELGKQNSLVTPATSMLVLDSLGQYLLYKVEPPTSMPFHEIGRASCRERV